MLNYRISLGSVPFDNSYINAIRFNNREEQAAYFNLATRFDNAPQVNFNVSSLLTTTVVVNALDLKLNPIMNYNYAFVKDDNPDAILPYYFYFVTQIVQQSGNQIRVEMELDVIQTYYIDLTFQDCVINRAHLDRFIPVTNSNQYNIKFNLDSRSPLHDSEKVDLPKRCFWRNRIKLNYSNGTQSGFNLHWSDYQEQGGAWIYVYLNAQGKTQTGADTFMFNELELPYAVIAAPTIPQNVEQDGTRFKWSAADLFKLLNRGAIMSNVLAVKISPIAPFTYQNYNNSFYKVGNAFTLLVDGGGAVGNLVFERKSFSDPSLTVDFCSVVSQPLPVTSRIWLQGNFPINFLKSEIVNKVVHVPEYNPKLLNQNFVEIKVEDYSGNEFSYDISKINQEYIDIYVSEMFTPDVTKGKVWIKIDSIILSALGSSDFVNNSFFGLIYSNDTQYPFSESQLSAFLAQNKNFSLQQQAQRNYNTKSTLANAATGLVGSVGKAANASTPWGAAATAAAGVTEAANTVYQGYLRNELSRKQESFTLDNARNAPDSIKNAQGNVFFNMLTSDFGFYVSYWSALETDKIKIDDTMHRFGFSYERTGNVKDFDNIRHYFNYIEADVENMEFVHNISNDVHDKIRQIFRNGIRFWNVINGQVTFDYTPENYERWLDE